MIALDLAGVRVSAGAACSSGKVARSHVLAAMGLGEAAAGAPSASPCPGTRRRMRRSVSSRRGPPCGTGCRGARHRRQGERRAKRHPFGASPSQLTFTVNSASPSPEIQPEIAFAGQLGAELHLDPLGPLRQRGHRAVEHPEQIAERRQPLAEGLGAGLGDGPADADLGQPRSLFAAAAKVKLAAFAMSTCNRAGIPLSSRR